MLVEEPLELVKRRAVIVWVYSLKNLKTLKRFGMIHYVSRRMKYVVIYMNDDEYEAAEEKINKLHFVRKVEHSFRPDLEMNFASRTTKRTFEPVEDEPFEIEELAAEIRLAEHL